MRTPTDVLPVKLTMSTSLESTRATPASGPDDVTTLTTPGGNPTSSMMRASSMTASGSWGAGLMTTVLPAESEGATLHGVHVTGWLTGVVIAHMQPGWRTA